MIALTHAEYLRMFQSRNWNLQEGEKHKSKHVFIIYI